MFDYEFEYVFHPVGQGLFATGSLYMSPRHQSFVWVYDCGTTSSQKLLISAINQTAQRSGKNKIDLAVISHFDKDHISGFPELLGKFTVDTLLLPYIPLWQRLLIAFEEEIETDSEQIVFFLNPVEYINNLGGIGRVVFVLPSGPDGPPAPDAESPLLGPEKLAEETQSRKILDSPEPMLRILPGDIDEPSGEDKHALDDASRSGLNVLFLKSGKRLAVSNLWEFVPYNDQDLAPKNWTSFRKEVDRLTADLLSTEGGCARQKALIRLKGHYLKEFGKHSKVQNLISLFLFGGPVSSEVSHAHTCIRCVVGFPPSGMTPLRVCDLPWECRPSILYTGDGYLDRRGRLTRLAAYMGDSRVGDVGCFQVMHHGAVANWHNGVAEKFKPLVSVFCSDPSHKKHGHPHAPVLRDFWSYNPIRVDKLSGLIIRGRVVLK